MWTKALVLARPGEGLAPLGLTLICKPQLSEKEVQLRIVFCAIRISSAQEKELDGVSIISSFHSRAYVGPDITIPPEHGPQKTTKDPKLTRYYSRYLNIIFSTMKKGIFLTKALNYL